MTANVAAVGDMDDHRPSTGETDLSSANSLGIETRSRRLIDEFDTSLSGGRGKASPTAHSSNATEIGATETDPGELFGTNDGQAQLDRLRAAISDDVQRHSEPLTPEGSVTDVRSRVESLLSRARRLIEGGQFDEAHSTAQAAQELGELEKLDYSPEEERPIDLVHRIESEIRTMRESETRDESEIESTLSNQAQPQQNDQESKPTSGEASGNRNWLLGRGVNVFRRERKPGSNESGIVPAGSKSSSPVSLSLESEPGNGEPRVSSESNAAIVQANRSVRLSSVSSPPRDENHNEALPSIQRSVERVTSSDSDVSMIDRSEISSPTQANEEKLDASLSEPVQRLTAPAVAERQNSGDDSIVTPTDLEAVRPVSPFRNVEGKHKPAIQEMPAQPARRSSVLTWVIGTLSLLTASLLALMGYRRRAT